MNINITEVAYVERYYYDEGMWWAQCSDSSFAILDSELDLVRENDCCICVFKTGDYILLTKKQFDTLVED